jgi:DNA-binding GntR family transcriptional regulator
VRTHRRLVDEIAAGNAEETQRIARRHLAATQALLLERFTDDVVNASSARAGWARASDSR